MKEKSEALNKFNEFKETVKKEVDQRFVAFVLTMGENIPHTSSQSTYKIARYGGN